MRLNSVAIKRSRNDFTTLLIAVAKSGNWILNRTEILVVRTICFDTLKFESKVTICVSI